VRITLHSPLDCPGCGHQFKGTWVPDAKTADQACLDTARTENQRLAEQLAQAVNESADDPEADNAPTPRTRAATRVKRASATRKPRLES
jgi:hypothetical protein